jgi:small subunit ribosomal protein S11
MVKQLKRFSGNKSRKTRSKGVVHIKSTFNNTIVNITDNEGNTLFWASAGCSGFKGAKKGTPFAAQSAAEKVVKIAYEQGMRDVEVVVSGPGSGRETAIRAVQGCGLQILVIKDVTPVPRNGCRPPKKRRV